MTEETKQFIKDLIDNESDYSYLSIKKECISFNRTVRVEPQLVVTCIRTEDAFTMELWDDGVIVDSDGGEGCFTLEDLSDFSDYLTIGYPCNVGHDEYEGVPV